MTQIQERASSRSNDWNTLDELRVYVVDHGWFSDDFECAIEAVGTDPTHVANYLQLVEFEDWLHAMRVTAAERKRIEQFELLVNLNLADML
jgi:hypothetical protein